MLWYRVHALLSPSIPAAPPERAASPQATAVIAAAQAQIGVTRGYDPSYVALSYPNGDVPRSTGVCTDVIIRALRDGLDIDLQRAVHTDMSAAFPRYPAIWGLHRPDPNIDHRRVPNLEVLLTRIGASLALPADMEALQPGDIITSGGTGQAPHIMLVSAYVTDEGTPLVIHNAGMGTRIENALPYFPPRALFRLEGAALARLRKLADG